jgi:hypothetical protein
MYKKEKATIKEHKKYIVGKKFQSGKALKKHGRRVKLVDPRMKKDTRGAIRAQKRKGKKRR